MQTLHKLMIFVSILLMPSFAHAKPMTEDAILKKYSYVEFVQALNGLQLAIVGDSWCSLDSAEAHQLILPFRPIYEKKLALEKKSLQKTSIAALEKRIQDCRKDCRCSSDEDLMNSRKDVPAARTEWLKKNHTFTSEEMKACAKHSTHLCKGPLLPSLKAIWSEEYKE